jgi:tetratricopeptide (TPR) repeat protein
MVHRVLGVALLAVLAVSQAAHSADEATGPMAQAVARFEASEIEAAETRFRELLTAEPARAAYYLGRIHLKRGDPEGAVEWFVQATEQDPSGSDYQLWLGSAYLARLQTASLFKKLGLSKKVRACYLKAIELDPDNISARESLAGYYFEAPGIAGGSTEKGLEQAREIKARDPRRGHNMLAAHYINEKSYDLAEREYSAALALSPDEPDTLYSLGQLFQTRGDSSKAFDYFERVLAANPDHLGSLYALGRAAAISGKNLDRGIECLQRFLTDEPAHDQPAHTFAHWRMGMIFEHKGDEGRAKRAYESALELDPDNGRASKALRKLS